MKRSLALFILLLVSFTPLSADAQTIAQRVAGKILLQVQQHGEAWYVHPEELQKYYLRDGAAAYTIMRFLSLGITDADLANIPAVVDTTEMKASGAVCATNALASRLAGRILLQVQQHGEAWYVDVDNCRRIYLRDGAAAYEIMRFLGLGITDIDLQAIPTAPGSALPNGGSTNQPLSGESALNDGKDSVRQALLAAINQERALSGLAPLTLVKELSLGAQNQANDMTNRNYFDFTTPEGKSFSQWISEAGYTAQKLAENLAQTNAPASSLVGTWKTQSPSSHANVVEVQHVDLGVGIGSFQGVPIYTVVFAKSLKDFFEEQTASLANLAEVRGQLLARVNQERTSAGLSALSMNALLTQAAQGHTDDMLARAFYAHESPEGVTPHERILATGYQGQKTAENIAKGQFSVQQVMDEWMDSPGHRANILDPEFTEIGFGLSYGENSNGYDILWAQEFGRPL